MKIDKCVITEGYVLTTPELTVWFNRFENGHAGDMLSVRLYENDKNVASVPHGKGEEFGRAWRAMQCK